MREKLFGHLSKNMGIGWDLKDKICVSWKS